MRSMRKSSKRICNLLLQSYFDALNRTGQAQDLRPQFEKWFYSHNGFSTALSNTRTRRPSFSLLANHFSLLLIHLFHIFRGRVQGFYLHSPKNFINWTDMEITREIVERTAELSCLRFDNVEEFIEEFDKICLLYTSPSPRDLSTSRMPSSA